MTYPNAEQLEALQQALMSLQEDLRTQLKLGKSGAATVILDQSKVGRLSRMDAIQQQKMAESSQLNSERRLHRVLHALQKFDSGDYGYCEECGEAIGFPRLKVQPEAPLCLHCQSRLETA